MCHISRFTKESVLMIELEVRNCFNRLEKCSKTKRQFYSSSCQFRHMMSTDRQSFITQFFFLVSVSLAHLLFDLTSLSIPGIVMFTASFVPFKPVSNQFYSVNLFLLSALICVCLSRSISAARWFFLCGIGWCFKNASKWEKGIHVFPSSELIVFWHRWKTDSLNNVEHSKAKTPIQFEKSLAAK